MARTNSKSSGRFSLVNELYERVMGLATVTRNGDIRIKRTELKVALEEVMLDGAKRAASGERIRFPVIGALVTKTVKARKAGKGKNPFTGEEIMLKARPESRKPRWSFPKGVKETFASKKNW